MSASMTPTPTARIVQARVDKGPARPRFRWSWATSAGVHGQNTDRSTVAAPGHHTTETPATCGERADSSHRDEGSRIVGEPYQGAERVVGSRRHHDHVVPQILACREALEGN